jgi:hypothetical protein
MTGRIDDDQRHLPDLVAGARLAGEEAVRAGVVAVVGREYNDGVGGDVRGRASTTAPIWPSRMFMIWV